MASISFTPSARAASSTCSNKLSDMNLVRQEQRLDVALEQVFRDVAGDAGFAGLQHVEILVSHLGGYLEAHVQQLAQIRIEPWILLIVTQRGRVLFGSPSIDDCRGGQLCVVDIDHRGVRLAQGVAIFKGFGVYLLRKVQTRAAG